jgi:hypothetical protein
LFFIKLNASKSILKSIYNIIKGDKIHDRNIVEDIKILTEKTIGYNKSDCIKIGKLKIIQAL